MGGRHRKPPLRPDSSKAPGFSLHPEVANVDEAILHPPQGGGDWSDRAAAQQGFDLNYGRDEMTSGGQREHRVEVLEQNLRNMDLDPEVSPSTQMVSDMVRRRMRVGALELRGF